MWNWGLFLYKKIYVNCTFKILIFIIINIEKTKVRICNGPWAEKTVRIFICRNDTYKTLLPQKCSSISDG